MIGILVFFIVFFTVSAFFDKARNYDSQGFVGLNILGLRTTWSRLWHALGALRAIIVFLGIFYYAFCSDLNIERSEIFFVFSFLIVIVFNYRLFIFSLILGVGTKALIDRIPSFYKLIIYMAGIVSKVVLLTQWYLYH